jgi:hypothetical protein
MQERIHKDKCLIMRDFLMSLRNYKLRQRKSMRFQFHDTPDRKKWLTVTG